MKLSIGAAMLDFVLKPLQLLLEGALALGDALNIDVPKGVRTFAEKGFSGLIFPKPEEEKAFKEGVPKMPLLVKPEDLHWQRKKAFETLAKPAVMDLERKKAIDKHSAAKKAAELEAKKEGAKESAFLNALKNALPDLDVKLEDKRQFDLQSNLCVDGEALNIASGRHKIELQERAGFKATPWQKRAILEHGAAPMRRG
jgi:hypothetical protein